MTTQRRTPSTTPPTLEESLAAQARLKQSGRLASAQPEPAGVARGCAIAFALVVLFVVMVPAFIGGWVAFWGLF